MQQRCCGTPDACKAYERNDKEKRCGRSDFWWGTVEWVWLKIWKKRGEHPRTTHRKLQYSGVHDFPQWLKRAREAVSMHLSKRAASGWRYTSAHTCEETIHERPFLNTKPSECSRHGAIDLSWCYRVECECRNVDDLLIVWEWGLLVQVCTFNGKLNLWRHEYWSMLEILICKIRMFWTSFLTVIIEIVSLIVMQNKTLYWYSMKIGNKKLIGSKNWNSGSLHRLYP